MRWTGASQVQVGSFSSMVMQYLPWGRRQPSFERACWLCIKRRVNGVTGSHRCPRRSLCVKFWILVNRMIGFLSGFVSGVLLTTTGAHALDNGVARLPGMSSFCMTFTEAD